MKSSDTWFGELCFLRKHPEDCNAVLSIGDIEKIQNDAYNQAIGDAINIANEFGDYDIDRDGRVIAREIVKLIKE